LLEKSSPKIAKLVTNIVYVGVLAEILGITDQARTRLLLSNSKEKQAPLNSTLTALELGRNHFKENFTKGDPYVVEERPIEEDRSSSSKEMKQSHLVASLVAFNSLHGTQLHPLHLAEGIIGWIPRLRTNDEGKLLVPLFKQRMNLLQRDGPWRWMGWWTRNDCNIWPWYFAYAGIHWFGLLC